MQYRRRSSLPDVDHDTLRCVVDDQGRIIFASPALGWSLGQSSARLAGKLLSSILSIVSSADGAAAPQNIAEINSGFFEVALIRPDRDPFLVPARIDRVTAEGERALTVIWLDPDNTLRRRHSDDIGSAATDFAKFVSDNQSKPQTLSRASQPDLDYISQGDSELKHFIDLTRDLLGVCRRDMSFAKVNPSFNHVLGFSDAELKTLSFLDLVLPDEKQRVELILQRLVHAPADQDIRIDFECRTRCRDGSFRWIEWVHKAVGPCVYIVGRDITDIKQHEAELQRREQQLSEAQKIGRMGNWYWEVGQNAMEWSDQIYSIFGVEKGLFVPMTDTVTPIVHKGDLQRIYRSFLRAQADKRDYEFEFRLRRPRGGVRYVRCEGRCKTNLKTGQVEAFFGIMQDITERTLHERALQAAKESAEQAYASKTRFLANMSHELRTPLNAIIGFSEMIQRQLLGPVGNARYLDYIGGIRQSGEHLLDLISDILDMSKIEVGKYELHTEDLNVGKVIRLAIHMIEGRAHESQVRLVTDSIPEDIHIVADRRALMQVLLNLMSNAVKFTRAGGAVEIRCAREQGGVSIVVADTGVGIPKDKIDVVTMPFEQVDSEFTRSHEGSGLGLAITKDLIELHGGTLDIQSDVGVGTTVTVLLPEKAVNTGAEKSSTSTSVA